MRYRDSFLVGSILLSAACGRTSLGTSTRDGSLGGARSTGAMTSAGGATQVIAGGTKATGGWTSAGGTQAMGGTLSVSGTTSTGGTQAAGGIPATGGTPPTGGAASIGGTTRTGGTKAAGGIPATGGAPSTGGATSIGGSTRTGGSNATGGMSGTGGTPPTGGATSAGGTTSTGGTQATGDASSGTGGNTPDASTSDLSAHLVAYYPFSGNTNDEGPNAMNGVNHGAVLTSDRKGNPNSAFHFNGKAYIDIPGGSALNGMSSFTLSAWINTEIAGPAAVISKVTPNRDFVLDLAAIASGNWVNAQFAHFGTYYHVWARQPEGMLNAWTFLTAVWTGSIWSLYINGGLAGESTVDGAVPLWTGTSFRIGTLTDDDWWFLGVIDEVRIYDKALTADEIDWVMQQ